MTNRERMTALIQGRWHDRVPFVQYDNMVPNDQAWSLVGRENLGLLRWTHVHRTETPNCSYEQEEIVIDGRKGVRNTIRTPEGTLSEERLIEPVFGSSAALTHFVKEPDDYKILMAFLRDTRVYKYLDWFQQAWNELGDDGLPHLTAVRTPYQQLWVQWVEVTELAWHLVEYPELMDEVVSEIERVQTDVYKVICEAVGELPIPYVNVGDNITAPMIGEKYFVKYAAKAYSQLARMLAETGKDIPVQVHMDGDLKVLWKAIEESGVRSLDSMSPPPDNDTSVADAISVWPEMSLCINFPSSVHLLPPDKIYQAAMEILEEGQRLGRLQIQISENVPPGVWKTSYPEIARAVRDFGEACSSI